MNNFERYRDRRNSSEDENPRDRSPPRPQELDDNMDGGRDGMPPHPPPYGDGPPPQPIQLDPAATMAAMMDAMQAMARSVVDINNRMVTMQGEHNRAMQQLQTQQLELQRQQQQNRQEPHRAPIKWTRTSFPKLVLSNLNEASKMEAVGRWRTGVENVLISMRTQLEGYPFREVSSAIIACLEDQTAINHARTLNLDDIRDIDAFWNAFSRAALGASAPEKAQALFDRRMQKDGEDTSTFHGELVNLYKSANPELGNNINNQKDLIRHFIKGCRNRSAISWAWQLHGEPNNYQVALEQVLAQEGRVESLACLESGKKYKGGDNSRANAPTPMDVNAVLDQRINAVKNQKFRKANQNDLRRAVKNQAASGSSAKAANSADAAKPVKSDRVKCYECKERGHIADECPQRRKKIGRVHAIQEAPEPDDSDEEIAAEQEENFDWTDSEAEEADTDDDEGGVNHVNVCHVAGNA